MIIKNIIRTCCALVIMLWFALPQTFAQTPAKGTLIHIKLHGKSLENNLDGDSVNRGVSIYLPASYYSNPNKHYPVVYFLHGFTDDEAKWYGLKRHWINMTTILDTVFVRNNLPEMIFVTPDAFTRYGGCMYSNAPTTGNWEDFVAKELVTYVDANYRTIAKASARGLAGHSMGGYGTFRIASKYPNVFSSIYLLSPASLATEGFTPDAKTDLSKLEAIKTPADFDKADFWNKYAIANLVAWAPNPNNPPLYCDALVKNGQLQADVVARITANIPLANFGRYLPALKQLHAIAFDAGNADAAIAASLGLLDTKLTENGIAHQYEIYQGNHINRIAQRISKKVVFFFAQNLEH